MTIKVKQARDLSTNEVIYFKGHAQATYLSDGTTVEDAINNIESSSGNSIDPSNYYTKTEIDGKGYVTSTQLEAKQDVISDIDTIRTNASNYKGTITGVSANGTSVATSGVANIPAASTSKYGVTKLTSATNSTSTVLAATASAVKAAYDLANSKQAALVSGTNIKTINGNSILGGGDITIQTGNNIIVLNIGTISSFANDIVVNLTDEQKNSISQTINSGASLLLTYTYMGKMSQCYLSLNVYGGYYRQFTGIANTVKNSIKFNGDKRVVQALCDTVNKTLTVTFSDVLITNSDITGGSSSGSSAYSEVSHGTADTTFELTPNTFHVWDEVTELDLSLGAETAGVANEYLFQFTSGNTATTLSLPDDIKWANDDVPAIETNKIYQISILKGLVSVLAFDNTPAIILINFTIDSSSFNAESGMMWSEWIASNYNTAGYIGIEQNKVIHKYTNDNLFTISGGTVNSSDVIQSIKYTFSNPWA